MLLARSAWRKSVVMVLVVLGMVWLYDVTMLDSRNVAPMAAEASARLEPGVQASFTGTAYCKGEVTASGVGVRSGIAAADPKLLPVGSVVEIDSSDSRYNGIYTILDTGPAVQGRIIDVYMWSCHEALRFGRRPLRLTVLRLGWSPGKSAPSFLN
jgi:3D (Asp-Asp-Asp) domain-containing protein